MLVRFVWLVFSWHFFLRSGCGLRPYPSLTSVFYLSHLRGCAEGTDRFESYLPNRPTHLPTAPHHMLLLSYLHVPYLQRSTRYHLPGSMINNVKITAASNDAMQDAQHLVETREHANSAYQWATKEKHRHEKD